MQRREFIAVGSAAAVASATQAFATQAFAETAGAKMEDMHPALYKALEKAAIECVSTGNECLRHCLGMFAMKDTSMTECADSSLQLVAACNALATLAAVNSSHVPALAKVVATMCEDCKKECDKFPKIAECVACGKACQKCAEECRKA
ncbi:MAG: four-helix bundle copper-binding protein [Alphaproteobacteria bacterium]|nr:four-helix bundle copper-binding protein [Alphaproteobacteria bacterium]MBM3652632.1 four-helix bundle copper-binding protein [Alphaproteobacteria bacterium]